MEFEHRLRTYDEVIGYMYAGHAIITLHVPGKRHFTYKIRKNPDDVFMYWVCVLCGPDNYANYRSLGKIQIHIHPYAHAEFVSTPGSDISNTELSFRWFHRFFYQLTEKNIPEPLEVWRANRCGQCQRRLTDPDSIACGIGPICRGEKGQ